MSAHDEVTVSADDAAFLGAYFDGRTMPSPEDQERFRSIVATHFPPPSRSALREKVVDALAERGWNRLMVREFLNVAMPVIAAEMAKRPLVDADSVHEDHAAGRQRDADVAWLEGKS